MNDQKLHKFEKNEICSMEYGINMNLVKFYEVTRRTDHYVWFERIDETFTNATSKLDGYGQEGWKEPSPSSSRRSKEFRLKIYISKFNGDEKADMKYQGLIQKWNGKPIYYNSMD